MHDPHAPSSLLADVCELSRVAGEKIMEIYRRGFDVDYKEDKSPVTEADLVSSELITQRLRELTPDWPVLSEEDSDAFPFAERSKWPIYWLVDPLDGTKGFIRRNGFFTVNIALVVGHEVTLGVIYTPDSRKLYYAARGAGAYSQTTDSESAQVISVRKTPRDKPIVVASRAHINVPTLRLIESLGEHELVRADSSLKCCLVADGSADLYLRVGPTCEWDTGAGQCIVEEAGGYLTDCSGAPIEYNRKESLINPSFVVHTPSSPPWRKFMPPSNG